MCWAGRGAGHFIVVLGRFMVVFHAMAEITFVMPWFDRPQIAECLQRNRDIFDVAGRNLAIVTSNSRRGAAVAHLTSAGILHCSLVLLSETTEFNKSRWLNIGVSRVRTDLVCLLDVDIVLTDAWVAETLAAMEPGTFIRLQSAEESMPSMHRQVLKTSSCLLEWRHTNKYTFLDGRTASIEFFQSRTGRSLCGLLLLRRADYIRVGGCNGELKGWGFEDEDLQIRLQIEAGLRPIANGSALHLTHPEHIPSDWLETNRKNLSLSFDNYSRGDYQGTYLSDISDSKLQSEVVHLEYDADKAEAGNLVHTISSR